jgi:hypothetical protein
MPKNQPAHDEDRDAPAEWKNEAGGRTRAKPHIFEEGLYAPPPRLSNMSRRASLYNFLMAKPVFYTKPT